MKLLKTLFCATAAWLAVGSADAATTLIPGVLKQERWNSPATRAQLEGGTIGTPNSVSLLSQWDRGDIADNYVARLSGVIIPDVTGTYDFYFSIDDDGTLYLGTNSTAASKYVIGQQTSWSGNKNWTSGGNDPLQRNSATWTNAAGMMPFANGISLTAGQRYYLECTQHEGGGGDNIAVTMVPHGQGITDGDATVLTGSLIGLEIQTPTALTFTVNPSNTTAYVGMAAHFNVATTTDSELPPGYQWRRNGVNIPGATSANYTLMASATDTGATFDCVSFVPAIGTPVLTRTSTVATVTVPASGGLTVAGYLKRQVIAGYTTANVRTNVANGNGGKGVASAVKVFDVPSAGANYAERVSGFFTPATSGAYVVFVAADDDTDVYLSTDDQPKNKRLVAQEDVWSNNRQWPVSGGGSTEYQRRSDTFVPDSNTGITPYADGIMLTAGQRYYIEAIHRAGGGGNGVSVTALLKADVDNSGGTIPADNDASTLTNGVISYVTSPVTSFSVAPLANVTVFEGLTYKFQTTVTTDSEVSPLYQWKKGGVAIAGATGASLSGTAALSDNGSTYSVDISIPGVTNFTSNAATLTVQQSVFAEGSLKVERWNDPAVTRAIVAANVTGTVPEPDSVRYVTSGLDVTDTGDNWVMRVTGFFVPATSGNYVFYLASDDDSNLYLGTNDKADTKRLIAQEDGWSNPRNWNTIGGGSTLSQRRSDQFSPDQGVTVPYANGIALTAGTRYYLEAVLHQGTGGAGVSATYGLVGDADPADGSATKLIGARVGVLVPAATAIGLVQDVSSVSVSPTQPVYLSVNATNNGLLPTSYQWRRGGTAIPGATGQGYNFVASSSDNGAQFTCVMSVSGTSLALTSSVANVTINNSASLVVGKLGQELWFGSLNRSQVEAGNAGTPTTIGSVTNIDIGTLGDNYVQRIRGYFIPPTTGKYTFFINSDDDSDLFLSTDDQPANKRLIAQQNGWSDPRKWVSSGTTGPYDVTQKRSDLWEADPLNPAPNGPVYAGGIQLTAGQKYYIEAVHAEGGGGDNLGVTYKFHATDTASASDPADDDPSKMFGSVIAYLAAPVANQQLSISREGNSVNVSWSPAGGRLLSTPALGDSAVWTDLGGNNPQSLPIGSGSLFLQVVTP